MHQPPISKWFFFALPLQGVCLLSTLRVIPHPPEWAFVIRMGTLAPLAVAVWAMEFEFEIESRDRRILFIVVHSLMIALNGIGFGLLAVILKG